MSSHTLIEHGQVLFAHETGLRSSSVLLSDDKIIAVGSEADRVALDCPHLERIDASGCSVVPGLIDAHCHITFAEPASNDELFFHRRQGFQAIVAAQNVQKLLRAGVTSFLDADVLWNLGVELRDAIDFGVINGPTMKTGGQALLTTVGGTAGTLIPDDGERGYAKIVKSREDIVSTVRTQIKHGVDWVKIHVTGIVPNQKHRGEVQVWNRDELVLACKTAHDLGTPVVAHCRNGDSVRDAALAGVDLILHATNMNRESMDVVIDRKVPLVPTLTFQANLADFGDQIGASRHLMDLFRREIECSAPQFREVYDAGVPVICGSESGFSITPYGEWHGREMEIFVKYLGISPEEAIGCATHKSAAVLGLDHTGRIEAGAQADILIVEGDPTQDIALLNQREKFKSVLVRGKAVDLSSRFPNVPKPPFDQVGVWSDGLLTRQRAFDQ